MSGIIINPYRFAASFPNEYCLEFDGVDDYVNIRNYTTYTSPASAPVERNFSFWYKAEGDQVSTTGATPVGGAQYVPFFCGRAEEEAHPLGRFSNGFAIVDGTLRWVLDAAIRAPGVLCHAISEAVDGTASHPNIQDGEWHHIFLYNKVTSTHADIADTEFWVDGANVPIDSSVSGSATLYGFYGGIALGAGNDGTSSGQYYLEGFIDEFAYWDGAYITDAAVEEIAGGPNDLDDLSNASDPDCWYRLGDNAPAYAISDPQWLIMNNKNAV